jgi:hypothetical protein
MTNTEITKEEMHLILNELKSFKGTLEELLSQQDTSSLIREWVVAWGPFCEYSNDITEYYPLPLKDL